MATFLINYNLDQGDSQYKQVAAAIKALGGTWHNRAALDSVWFLKADTTTQNVSDSILGALDTKKDYLFVVDITGRPRQGWMPKSFWQWLED